MPQNDPLQYSDKFKALSPQAQAIIRQKFEAFSPETKAAVTKKLTKLPDEVINEPGLTNVSLTPLPRSTMNRSAVDVTEGLAPIVGPRLAKAAGMAFEMIPPVVDTALTVGGTASLAKAGIGAAPAIGEAATAGLKRVGQAIAYSGEKEAARLLEKKAAVDLQEATQLGGMKSAAERVKGMASKATEQVKQAAEAPIAKIKQTIKQLPIRQKKVLESAQDELLQAKNAIGEAEKEIGIDISKVGSSKYKPMIDSPKKIQKFAAKYSDIIARQSPKALGKSLPAQDLQAIRKGAENAAKSTTDDGVRVELFKIEKHFRDAIGEGNKVFGDALGRFKTASQSVNSLPKEFDTQRKIMSSGLQQLNNLAKEKVLTDAKVVRLNGVADILERRAKELPRQFSKQKAEIDVAVQSARNLAQKQAHTRWLAGGGAVAAMAALAGRKALNLVTGGN